MGDMIKIILIPITLWAVSLSPMGSKEAAPIGGLSVQESAVFYSELKRLPELIGGGKSTTIVCSLENFKSKRYECFYKWDLGSGNPRLEQLSGQSQRALEKHLGPATKWGDSVSIKLDCQHKKHCSIMLE